MGDMSAAERLLARMQAQRPPLLPNIRTVNTLLRGCVRVGDVDLGYRSRRMFVCVCVCVYVCVCCMCIHTYVHTHMKETWMWGSGLATCCLVMSIKEDVCHMDSKRL